MRLSDDRSTGSVSVHADGMKTLAGVEKIGNTLWLAELFQMKVQDLEIKSEPMVNWKGNDESGNVWMADNVDVMVLIPSTCFALHTLQYLQAS